MAVPPFHWWRTVFFLIPAIAFYTVALGTLSLLSVLVDSQGHLAHRCARAWAWLILKTTGVTVDISGLDDLPRDRPYLFLANHQSIYDIPVLFWSILATLTAFAVGIAMGLCAGYFNGWVDAVLSYVADTVLSFTSRSTCSGVLSGRSTAAPA